MNPNVLALGTVQFGVEYGIANKTGKIDRPEAIRILRLAKSSNIDLIDTAIAYGESEKVLGEIGVGDFRVVSKLPKLPQNQNNIEAWVENKVRESLEKLGINALYGLLLHSSDDILGESGKRLAETLNEVKSRGWATKIGISIYDPSELDQVMSILEVDLVQAPLNLIDRRLESSGWLARLHQLGVEVHTRSSFLQGLLLMPRNHIPAKFDQWHDMWDRWHLELKKRNLPAAAVCLAYPLSLSEVDRVVVGVDTVGQLKDLIDMAQTEIYVKDWLFMDSSEQMLINPSNWSAL